MDACYSAATAIGSRVELLAAAAKDAQSSAQPEYSLTRALINCLSEQAGRPATVAYIHGKMLQDAERHKFSTTPIHAIMNRKPSITLTRLGHALPYQIPVPDDAELRVLITAKISHATQRLNKEEWRRYLTSNLPSFVEEMKVEIKAEGLFNSNSDVLLLSMPIYIYNVLKALGPYSFTALIASPNRLLKDPFLTNAPPGPIVGR